MSASEKLKELLPFKDWDAGGNPFENQPPLDELARVLPQIVAVVRAAETRDLPDGEEVLHNALKALDEALG